MTEPDSVLTVREVAIDLRCSKAHVYNVIKGKVKGVSPLEAIRMGRRTLVLRSSLERWKRANARTLGNAILPSSPELDAGGRV